MKVGVLKPVKVGKKIVFEVVKPAVDIPFDQIPNIVEAVIELNIQRYLIRNSRKPTNKKLVFN